MLFSWEIKPSLWNVNGVLIYKSEDDDTIHFPTQISWIIIYLDLNMVSGSGRGRFTCNISSFCEPCFGHIFMACNKLELLFIARASLELRCELGGAKAWAETSSRLETVLNLPQSSRRGGALCLSLHMFGGRFLRFQSALSCKSGENIDNGRQLSHPVASSPQHMQNRWLSATLQ